MPTAADKRRDLKSNRARERERYESVKIDNQSEREGESKRGREEVRGPAHWIGV